ncbi:MAG TPA: hypothetical protein VFZ53_30640 [Polyangiaceae bacterium]
MSGLWSCEAKRSPRAETPAFVAALAALVVLFFAPEALAQRVVLVRPPSSDALLVEAFNRLRAELRLQSFEVVVVDADPALASPDSVGAAAQREDAFAGISITRRAGATSADVWIADRVTGKTTMRTLALQSQREAPSVLAVRAVDLLRSSLRELPAGEEAPADVVSVDRDPVPESVRAWARPARPPWKLRVEGGALGSLSGVGLAYGGGAALTFRVADRFRIGAAFFGPLIGGEWTTSAGTAIVRQELAWLEGTFVALRTGPFELGVTLGAGAYHLEATSEVEPPLVARSDTVWSALGSVGPSASLHVTESLSFGVELAVLGLTPRPGVAVAEDETIFAMPAFRGALGLGVEF